MLEDLQPYYQRHNAYQPQQYQRSHQEFTTSNPSSNSSYSYALLPEMLPSPYTMATSFSSFYLTESNAKPNVHTSTDTMTSSSSSSASLTVSSLTGYSYGSDTSASASCSASGLNSNKKKPAASRICLTPSYAISDQGGGHCIVHGGARCCKVLDCAKNCQIKGLCRLHYSMFAT